MASQETLEASNAIESSSSIVELEESTKETAGKKQQQQQQQKATRSTSKAAVRHLEKRRTSTCRFADRIAQVALAEYRKHIPLEQQQPATCIAAILAHIRNSANADDESGHDQPQQQNSASHHHQQQQEEQLFVVGLGVGTKFLTNATLQQENESQSYGHRIRDCHAEVLARRAFRRQIMTMILQDLERGDSVVTCGRNPRNDDVNSGDSEQNNATEIIQRIPNFLHRVTNGAQTEDHEPVRYALRPGVTLHMYTSTAPCGNATLKKFATMEKERFLDHLGEYEWPTSPPHEVIAPHSWKLGQFALLLKRDSQPNKVLINDCTESSATTETAAAVATDASSTMTATTVTNIKTSGSRKRKTVPSCHPLENACPPGTCPVTNERGVVHTCSDKICRWNCLGLQGSLLSSLLTEPMYLSTLTVGRKLTACICRRAVCCRIGKDGEMVHWPKQNTEHNQKLKQHEQSPPPPPFHLVHPAILGTSVYVDEDAAIDMSTSISSKGSGGIKGQDVRFHSSLSWAWWPSMVTKSPQDSENSLATAECIDGTTGFLHQQSACDDAKVVLHSYPPVLVSNVSTAALQALYLEILARRDLENAVDKAADPQVTPTSYDSTSTTLMDLLMLKQRVAPLYEAAKRDLLSRHPVMRGWKRRDKSSRLSTSPVLPNQTR